MVPYLAAMAESHKTMLIKGAILKQIAVMWAVTHCMSVVKESCQLSVMMKKQNQTKKEEGKKNVIIVFRLADNHKS